MKILYVCPLLPHPRADHASSFMTYRLLRHLSGKHDVTVAAFARSEEEAKRSRHLGEFCREVRTVPLPERLGDKLRARLSLLALTPLAIAQAYSPEMKEEMRGMVRRERFDVVHLEYTTMGQYVGEAGSAVKVLSAPDLVAATAEKCVASLPFGRKQVEWALDGLLAIRWEAALCAKFDRVLAISRAIADRLLSASPHLNVSLLPIGVDIPPVRKSHNAENGKNIIFMGAMWRQENIDAVSYFYRSVFDKVRRAVPDVKLFIVGGSPSEEIQKLSADPGVVVTGFVNDLLPYYLESDVSIAPVRIAGGVMCKVLDAMAAGLPVVATSNGNAGVGAVHGKEILIADNPDDFARRTIELLQNRELRQSIGEGGGDLVRRRYSWDQIVKDLESIYEECMTRRPGRRASK